MCKANGGRASVQPDCTIPTDLHSEVAVLMSQALVSQSPRERMSLSTARVSSEYVIRTSAPIHMVCWSSAKQCYGPTCCSANCVDKVLL